MRVYVIRHGETESNAKGVFQGQTDSKLLESGHELARATGEALRGVKFDAAFSSPLSRARDTALEVLAASGNGDVPLVPDDRLLEIKMGCYEGKRFRPGEREADAEMCRLFFEDPFAEYHRNGQYREMAADIDRFAAQRGVSRTDVRIPGLYEWDEPEW